VEAISRSELENLIREVIHELLEMPITPHVRELRAKAVTYGRVINNWSTYPPTAPQVQAMHECVVELRDKVHAALRDVSRVSRKPSAPATSMSSRPPETTRSRVRNFPEAPETIPPGVAWNANVSDATGVRQRTRRDEVRTPSETPALSRSSAPSPPNTTTAPPPVSHPRPLDTPPPALLRSRRSR
jgi:hypothetical protein